VSDKAPVVIKNTTPHEVSFSEVTGKITRKVNRFNDGAAAEAGDNKEILREQTADASDNRQRVAVPEKNESARLRGAAGSTAESNRQHADDSRPPENRLYLDGATDAAGGNMMQPAQSPDPGINRQHAAPHLRAPSANQPVDAGRSATANILHEPGFKGEPDTVLAATPPATQNRIEPPPAMAFPDPAGTGPVEHGPAEPISSAVQTGVAEPNLLHPEQSDHAQNMLSIATGADAAPNRIRPIDPPKNAENVVFVPLPEPAGAEEPGLASNVALEAAADMPSEAGPAPSAAIAQDLQPLVAEEQRHASAMKLKISAAVEQHMHAVEAETTRLNRQLEKLGNQYAGLEKRRK
jgi:hypothetical protein